MPVRLQKYLADCGVASRRKCECIIQAGRVAVNDRIATIGDSVDPDVDVITLDHRPVVREKKFYVLLNKPEGTVTTVRDTHNRKTVLDSIQGVDARLFPVGRLDMDVSGALLLTNDGELGHRLAHPRYDVDKVYNAWVRGRVSDDTARQLEQGVELEDGRTAPAKVKVLKRTGDATLLRLTVHEGRKRLVKRMCAAVGHPVQRLRRIAMAGINVRDLMPGEWRHLTDEEISRLRRLTKMD